MNVFFTHTRAACHSRLPPTFASKVSGAHTAMLLGWNRLSGCEKRKTNNARRAPYLLVLINGISSANPDEQQFALPTRMPND
jgi:hypothetical protein